MDGQKDGELDYINPFFQNVGIKSINSHFYPKKYITYIYITYTEKKFYSLLYLYNFSDESYLCQTD